MTKLQTKSHKKLAKKKYFKLLSYPWKFSFLCKNNRFSNIYSLLQLHDSTTKKNFSEIQKHRYITKTVYFKSL